MSFTARAMTLFPALHLLLAGNAFISWVRWPRVEGSVFFLFWLYVFPPLCLRAHRAIFGVSRSVSRISDPGYCPWWGEHSIQLLFVAIPALEGVLRIIPGVYSAWLRLWGSKIGARVHWVPTILVSDRAQLVIGSDVILGHRVELHCHAINPRKNGMRLIFMPITIKDKAMIGAGSHLGPGTVVEEGAVIKILTNIHPFNRKVDAES